MLHRPGVWTMLVVIGVILAQTAFKVGVNSPHFVWSLVILLLVAGITLTLRYRRDRRRSTQ